MQYDSFIWNFCSILFTFADAQPPPAAEVVKKAEIPHAEGAVFKFNNSAVYAGCRGGDQSIEFFWKFGFDSLEKYFLHLGRVTPASLDQTKAVLEKRECLQFYLDDLQKKIHDGMDKLKAIESISMEIMTVQVMCCAMRILKVLRLSLILYRDRLKRRYRLLTSSTNSQLLPPDRAP